VQARGVGVVLLRVATDVHVEDDAAGPVGPGAVTEYDRLFARGYQALVRCLVASAEDWDVDRMPVFMAATPEFVQQHPDAAVGYLKAWMSVADDFRNNRKKVSDTIYSFYTSKGYKLSPATFAKAIGTVEVSPGFPSGLQGYMQEQAQVLLREKKIKEMPDWSKALRPEFMQKARG